MPREIPGPKGKALSLFLERVHDPLEMIRHLTNEYGPVVSMHLLQERWLIVLEPDMIGDILVHQARHFHKAPDFKRADVFLGQHDILLIDEEEHARIRRLVQPSFHHERIVAYADLMVRHGRKWRERWEPGGVYDMLTESSNLSRQIAVEALFGSSSEQDAEQISRALTLLMGSFHRLVVPFAKLWLHTPFPKARELEGAIKTFDQTILRLVEERRKSGQDRGDLLSTLLAAQDTEGGTRPLSNEELHDQIAGIYLAGHETTARALTWSWYELAKHPEMQDALIREVKELMGDRPGTFEGAQKLPYTRAVMSEALRLYPPAWTLTRQAVADVEINGYLIPKGTSVFISQYFVHRDPRWWPEAAEFKPERWLQKPQPERPKFSYFPFGGGARICVAENFAWMEGILLLATFAQKWRFSVCDKTDDPPELRSELNMSPKNGMFLRVDPL